MRNILRKCRGHKTINVGFTLVLGVVLMLLVATNGCATEEPRIVVQASEVLQKIADRQTIEYNHALIIGNLDQLPKVISSEIHITDTIIEGNVDLHDSIFEKNVYFTYTRFDGYANFSHSNFSDLVDFSNSSFFKEALFDNSKFKSGTVFYHCWFNKEAYFSYSQMEWIAQFDEVTFNDIAYFIGTEFKGDTYFTDSEFTGNAIFWGSHFSKQLYFTRVKFSYIELQWSNINTLICEDASTYLELIKNFKDKGQFDDADNCYYQYRSWSQNQKNWGFSKLLDLIAWLSCGYGVRPSYTLAMSSAIIFIFCVLFWLFDGFFISATAEYKTPNIAAWSFSLGFSSLKKMLSKNVFSYSWKTVTSWARYAKIMISELRIDDVKQNFAAYWKRSFTVKHSFAETLYFSSMVFFSKPPQNWLPRAKWRYVVMIEGILGWLLLALFIITVSRIMIR